MGKTSFKSKNYQFEDILEIVDIDLCGPIGVESYTREKLNLKTLKTMMVVV